MIQFLYRYKTRALFFFTLLGMTMIILIMRHYDWKQTDHRGERWITPFNMQTVNNISFITSNLDFKIFKDADGVWKTPNRQGFPIAIDKINNFLYRIERLRLAQNIPGATDSILGNFLLNNPNQSHKQTGMLIRIQCEQDPEVREVVAGRMVTYQNMVGNRMIESQPTGRYYYNDLIGMGAATETFDMLKHGPSYWITRDIFAIEHVHHVSFTTLPDQKLRWSLSRESVSRGYKFDGYTDAVNQEAIMSYITPWRTPNFFDAVPLDDVNAQRTGILKVVTADGLEYNITIARRPAKTEKDKPLHFYWFTVNYTDKPPKQDYNFAADGTPIQLPRNKDFVQRKYDHEKQFEKWAYILEPATYQTIQAIRNDFIYYPPAPRASLSTPKN